MFNSLEMLIIICIVCMGFLMIVMPEMKKFQALMALFFVGIIVATILQDQGKYTDMQERYENLQAKIVFCTENDGISQEALMEVLEDAIEYNQQAEKYNKECFSALVVKLLSNVSSEDSHNMKKYELKLIDCELLQEYSQ